VGGYWAAQPTTGGPAPDNVFALYAEYARSFLSGGSQPFLFY
jgi:hypothetical protein